MHDEKTKTKDQEKGISSPRFLQKNKESESNNVEHAFYFIKRCVERSHFQQQLEMVTVAILHMLVRCE